MFARFLGGALALAAVLGGAPVLRAQQSYTPTLFELTVYQVDLSTDGTTWVNVFQDTAGHKVNLADSSAFANAFGTETPIPAGTYKWIRMEISRTLKWSYPDPPISLSNQSITITNGPPGTSPDKMTAYFATHDQGGKPSGPGGGDGTKEKPLLLGLGANIVAGRDTTLRLVFRVTNTLVDQGNGYDLMPPEMFFVAENDSAASLSGSFNTVIYNSIKEFQRDNNGNYQTQTWKFFSGKGTLTFDGAGAWTWTGTENELDLKGGGSGSVTTNATMSGRYGVNADGSFWMLATGEPGTLQGAVSADKTMLVATMYDSQSSHLMVYGVKKATSASASTMSGGYYYTTYGTRWDAPTSTFEYEASFGIVTGDGAGGVTGSQENNKMRITNPTSNSPTFSGPTATSGGSFSDTLTVNADGTLTNSSGDLGGGILESGDAACVGAAFGTSPYQPTNSFGFLVRQSAAGTFTVASLNGSYFGGFFGDHYDAPQSQSRYFSGFFRMTFDGAGSCSVTLVQNQEAEMEVETFTVSYTVDSTTGIVSFSDDNGGDADIKGAIGPGARSFILTAHYKPNGQANMQRFLGLGLKQ